jgi:alpha-galactosidase
MRSLALSPLHDRVFLGGVLAAALACCPDAAMAAQTTLTISMASPPSAARIQGAPMVATVPGSPFLYTIAASGEKPITFSATDLPAGLTLDATSGQITGSVATAGNYSVMVHASNGAGSDDKTLVIAAGTELAPTPPMGWNSYDSYGSSVTESDVMMEATAQAAVLQPFGWNTVVIDYLWFDPEDTLDANGRYLPSKSKFPSATGALGFGPLAAKIHALGLSFGIHIMRGIPRSAVTANSPIAGSTFTATNAGNTSDACPWDSHMWGVTVTGDTSAGQAW